ncbi:hypothetical protein, partial [Phocaeicola plebeius]|uniref:hypothetical protein n=1 Tax=Phocaeicola plebeius TaxID=310297 RepID=UPI0022E2AAED
THIYQLKLIPPTGKNKTDKKDRYSPQTVFAVEGGTCAGLFFNRYLRRGIPFLRVPLNRDN